LISPSQPGRGCIAADAEDDGAGGLELLKGIPEAAGLNRTARSIGSRVKEEYDGLAGVVGEAYGLILVGLQGEIGDFLVDFHSHLLRSGEIWRAGVAIRMHYFRGGWGMSPGRNWIVLVKAYAKTRWGGRGRGAALAAGALLPVMALAQYPGQITKKSKDTPNLRAIAVLEWTGDVGKPKASRMVPVTVYDGEKLNDAGIYMARPQPLALAGEVEYELKENGKTVGLFDIENAGQEQGSWVGYGKWKALPAPKQPRMTAPEKVDSVEDDKPVLHRKHPGGESSGGDGKGGTKKTASSAPDAPDDPDRPKLHKTDDSESKSTASSEPAPDPDRPRLEKKPDTSKTASPSPGSEGPSLQKARPQLAQDIGDVSSVADSDPDRPMLKRGKSSGSGLEVVPSLMGLPADMQQVVAVSDAKSRPEHVWSYAWSNPDDEKKMKAMVEEIARQALGLGSAPTAPAVAMKKAGAAAHRTVKHTVSPQPEPAPLGNEQFRVFELAYGSGATMVLTADNGAPAASRKFVTIIAQPDLYGNVLVLMKSVTDTAHLDETPRMRLVDAVDALADNRGELLFELRGEGSRQFGLYRIYRGTVEKLFVSGGGVYGTMSSE
jgi:hypothetical protein